MTRLTLRVQPASLAARTDAGWHEVPLEVTHEGDRVQTTAGSLWSAALEAARVAGPESATELWVIDDPGTTVTWDRETLGAPYPVILATDRRTDPTLSARREWLRIHEPRLWQVVQEGGYAVGTAGDYLVARMTRGLYEEPGPGVLTDPGCFLGRQVPVRAG